ncbi:MAG: hypothetical protein RR590_01660 [Hungatella sp.]
MKRTGHKRSSFFRIGIVAVCLSVLLSITAFAREPYAAPEGVWWSSMTVARWEKVDKAKEYEVKLYEDDRVIKTLRVDTSYVDCVEYLKNDRAYFFAVRAIPKTASDKQSYTASEWMESEYQTPTNMGDTDGHFRSFQSGIKYQMADGNYVQASWHKISSKWYYFNDDGYAVAGWNQINNLWYYCNDEGVMQTGWLERNGVWYYLQPNGAMAVGWIQAEPNQWYYMNSDGSMAANTTIDGYVLDARGRCNR